MPIIHITANSRLTASIKQQAVIQSQQKVIETPVVMTLSQWWQLWQDQALLKGIVPLSSLPDKILTPFESQWLFEQSLQQVLDKRQAVTDEESELESEFGNESNSPSANQSSTEPSKVISLLNPSVAAKQLYQAWVLLAQWVPDWQNHSLMQPALLSVETELLIEVLEHYLKHLKKHNWQDEALFSNIRLSLLAQTDFELLPEVFMLHGFDDLTPELKAWQKIVEAQGCQVQMADEVTLNSSGELSHQGLSCYPAQDIYDEVSQATQWAIDRLHELAKTKPLEDIKIALVAPDVSEYKSKLIQSLDEQLFLNGLSLLNTQTSHNARQLYNISLGEPLLNVPLVANGFQTISLFLQPHQTVRYALWSEWLTSAYTRGALIERHQADVAMRKLQWSTLKWRNLLDNEAAKLLPKSLLERIQNWHSYFENRSHHIVTLSEFMQTVWSLLNQLGWPGSRTLSSAEYQQKIAFENALLSFSALTDLSNKQNYRAWLTLLNRFLSEQIHQPQSVGAQPIQVMGMLEAGGQKFDGLWILGLTNEAWPRLPSPNPFIPIALQRANELPRSDASRELRYARQLSQRLVNSANNIVWSYPKQKGDATLLPTSIFPRINQAQSGQNGEVLSFKTTEVRSIAQTLYAAAQKNTDDKNIENSCLQWPLDSLGLPIEEGAKAPGGTGILQAQSQCPLMAYIDYRLGAKYGLEEVEEGLQNSNQGTLIHLVLEYFWQEVGTQPALLSLTHQQRMECLQKHINQAFEEVQNGLTEGLERVEKSRILTLCLEWLTLEENRSSFAVLETEQAHCIELAGIEFKIKIDRIDQVGSDALIIDYKSGKASISNLLKTPLKAPQLAMYLYACEQQVAGLGYGLLHSDDGVKFSALVEHEEVINKSRSLKIYSAMAKKEDSEYHETTWNDFLASLQQQVWQLAEEIKQGQAAMTFESPSDIEYASGYLALRVPEVMQKMAEHHALHSKPKSSVMPRQEIANES